MARLGPHDRLVQQPSLRLWEAELGSVPRRRTAVRLGIRDGELLVRFDGRDDALVATKTRRDDALWLEDVFEVFLTPHDPPSVYYEFQVNPLGTLFDARIESPHLQRPTICVDVAWNCRGLRAHVQRRKDRWSARLTIPLAPLLPPGQAHLPSRWRANLFRVDRGKPDEFSAWSPVGQPLDFHRATRFGTLELSALSSTGSHE